MKSIKNVIISKIIKRDSLTLLWIKLDYLMRRYSRYRFLFYSIALLVFILLLNMVNSLQFDYNGKYIKELSDDDRICRLLLEDIHEFKEKYSGKGGVSIDSALKVVLYKVRAGDSLWQISQKTGLSIDALLSMNQQNNSHILQPGQEIHIPNKDGILYKIKEGETLEGVAEKFKVDKSDILNVNELTETAIEEGKDVFIPNGKYQLQERINILGRFLLPVIGRVSSGFGRRRGPKSRKMEFHYGIDIANVAGTPVRAAEAGQVIFMGTRGGYGKLIILKHSNGYSTRYGHLSRYKVKHGQRVRQGQVIGYVGSTGNVTGPHVHFEIRRYGRPLNPYFIMRFSQK
ncbi:MAG: M23 family metallopeptidase [Spirochaetes bacterium]|nr:M23 family metallopeptidase [Spirochaetota bacterium]